MIWAMIWAIVHIWLVVWSLSFAYVLGGCPFAFWAAKRNKGEKFDIRDHSTDSVDFPNVCRVLGFRVAVLVFALDILKGALPAVLGLLIGGPLLGGLCLMAAIIGHNKSWYFRLEEGVFSGGKGVATALGGIIVHEPRIALVVTGAFVVGLLIFRRISVGTIIAGMAAVAISYARHQYFYAELFGALLLVLLYTHRRNLARIYEGTETAIEIRRQENEVIVSAFLLHPVMMSDLGQSRLSAWIPKLVEQGYISKRDANQITALGFVMDLDEITGIEFQDGTGRRGRILILCVPLLPSQIKDPAYQPILKRLLEAAAVQAQRRGASILTLGGMLSSESNGGADLKKWCEERGLTIKIDNGAGHTIASTLEVIVRESPIEISDDPCRNTEKGPKVGVVGAGGLIGHGVCRELQRMGLNVIAYARNEAKIEDLEERNTLLTTSLEAIAGCDIVVLATSHPDFIITKENAYLIKKGAMVVDVGVPDDFDDRVLKDRPDIKLVRSGMNRLPGLPVCKSDFHFDGEDVIVIDKHWWGLSGRWQRVQYIPACMAQGLMLAATGEYEHVSLRAKIRSESVWFFRETAKRLVIEIITSEKSETKIYGRGVDAP